MKKNEKQKAQKPAFHIAVGIALLIVVGIGIIFALGGIGNDNNEQVRTFIIKTSYVTLQYPEKYKKFLKHEEIRQDADSTVVFTMTYEDLEAELFRLSFMAEAPEEYDGYFDAEGTELYVSIIASGFDYGIFGVDNTEDDLEMREEVQALYYGMLDGMSTVMESVRKDTRFSEIRGVSESAKQEQALSYWKISIPDVMTCVESEQNGVYRVTFSTHIGDKAIDLYTISMGDTSAESIIGQYVSNGKSRGVSVELNTIDTEELSAKELELTYAMMDTVNDVLQAIRRDKNFHDQVEPAA